MNTTDGSSAELQPLADLDHDAPIYHLALPEEWTAAITDGQYCISTRAMSLDEVGYIHCSTKDQVETVANNFYGDLDLLMHLTIDPRLVPSEIRFEPPAPGSPLLFPHIYGPLPIAAVNLARPWTREVSGWSLRSL